MVSKFKLAVFDMDGTLINGRLIEALSKKFGLYTKVKEIQNDSSIFGYIKTQKIASLLKGIEEKEIMIAIESIPLMEGTKQVISTLKKAGFKTGIVTDSYSVAANNVAEKLGLDFFSSNRLRVSNGIITGDIDMPLGWDKINCYCKISVCKRYHLESHAMRYNIGIQDTVAIGDTQSDLCMVERAGTGIAFMPKDKQIGRCNNIINRPNLTDMLGFIDLSFSF
ncbi:MAG: HAD-IB family phosphatase [Candidatus Nitrosocosmicus sp.]